MASAPAATTTTGNKAEPEMDDDFVNALAKNMEALLKEQGLSGLGGGPPLPNDGELKDALQDMASGKTPNMDSLKTLDQQTTSATEATSTNPIEAHVNRTLQKLRETETQQQQEMDAGLPGEDDPAMEAMMKELEGLLAGEDIDNVLGGLMDQIMSKELLHEPMKDLASKVLNALAFFSIITLTSLKLQFQYPVWLKENRSTLSKEDAERYDSQLTIIHQIIAIYDNSPGQDASPEDAKKVMDLVQEMEKCGSPPEAILKELAPDLEGAGTDGGVPNLTALAAASGGGGANGDCSIM